MLTDEQKKLFSSLRVEIIDLNILSCFFIRKINRFGYIFQKTTRHYLLEELTALRYMENGLILHLTNLDDDVSKFSFRAVLKEVGRTHKNQKEVNKLKDKLDKYRKHINSLKVKHRNLRIAHLNYLTDISIDQFLNFDKQVKPLVQEATEIVDLLWGERIEYKFKLGSLEGILNFREIFDTLKFDINSQKEFT